MFPFAIPYPEVPEVGYWGIPTATIDWCEENYVVSPYIAELVNTVTNLAFVCFAGFALVNVLLNQHERRFLLVALGFITVGFGSWMFHMSLLYEYQLLDELPMIYATCVPYWIVFSYGKSRYDSAKVGIQISAFAVTLTLLYLKYRDPTIHQVSYGVLTGIVMLKSVFLVNEHVYIVETRKQMNAIMIRGFVYIAIGYFLWNTDIHLCTLYRSTRRSIGMPYGFVLEGHAWWHLLTGIGVYHYIVYLEHLRVFLIHREADYEIKWSLLILPHLDLTSKAKAASITRKTA